MREDRKVKIGNFLFKHRGILPAPFIILLLVFGSSPISLKSNLLKISGILISILGEIIRMFVAGFAKEKTSGRGMTIEASTLVNYGLYSIVRNPLYIGNFLIFFGFLLFSENLLMILFGSIIFWIYYYYIVVAEENFLRKKFGKEYDDFLKNVPRFIPKGFKIKLPKDKYDLKKAIFREKDTIFIWIVAFSFLKERLCNFCKPKLSFILIVSISLIFWITINLYKRMKK